jgi:type IV secretion system protein VirB11
MLEQNNEVTAVKIDYISGDEGGIARSASVDFHLEPIEQWLKDPEVTEIAINRPHEVFVEKNGKWSEPMKVEELTYDHLVSLSTAVAKFSKSGDISNTRPVASAILPNGERIQIVLPPACEHGTVSITIRKPSNKIWSLEDYQKQGFFDQIHPLSTELTADEKELLDLKENEEYLEFLKKAVEHEKVIIIAGETGSGKTTFMKGLMQIMSPELRIVTIEDVPELFLPNHPNHVHLFYPSEASEEDKSPVTSASLLKSCLRMKPDRILLAELRGAETYDFINVCSSGHGGSISSCHAGSPELTFERLALMILQNRQGRTLPYDVIRRLLYLIVDVIVHVHNDPLSGKGRHITEIWYDPMKKREK